MTYSELLTALAMAISYIEYIKEHNPALHSEADGSPSIEATILTMLEYTSGVTNGSKRFA